MIGDVTPVNGGETLAAVASILFGVLVNATIIGAIAALVAGLDFAPAVLGHQGSA